MKKLAAIVIACALWPAMAAEDEGPMEAVLGGAEVLVIEESPPMDADPVCAGNPSTNSMECMDRYTAVLTARVAKRPLARARATWI
jgi:hypothetical protein